MNDYIPRPDAAFDAWINQFIAAAVAWWDLHGGDGQLDDLRNLRDAWHQAYAASVAADAAARAATNTKKQARAQCEQTARAMVRLIQSTPDTTDAQRADMGITVREPGGGAPVMTPRTAPVATVNVPARLTHELRLIDAGEGASSPQSGPRRGKPEGVAGAEVWVKLIDPGTPAPTDPTALNFLTLTTRPTLRTNFRPADGGKTAVYMLRWVNTRGEKGPWSEVATATVAA